MAALSVSGRESAEQARTPTLFLSRAQRPGQEPRAQLEAVATPRPLKDAFRITTVSGSRSLARSTRELTQGTTTFDRREYDRRHRRPDLRRPVHQECEVPAGRHRTGDGSGPVKWYERLGGPSRAGSWVGHDLVGRPMIHPHSLQVADIDGDGNLDIFVAEMAKWSESKKAQCRFPDQGSHRRLVGTNGGPPPSGWQAAAHVSPSRARAGPPAPRPEARRRRTAIAPGR